MTKLAGVYERNGRLFVAAYHQTEAGFWIADAAVHIVEGRDPVILRQVILSALAASRTGVPTPAPNADPTSSLLRAAGARSWNAFATSAKEVEISLIDGAIRITPSANLGPRGGFSPMLDKVTTVLETDHDLSAAVLAAFATAR